MSINILPTPSSTVPIGNDDYTAQNGKIEGGLALSHEILTGWESTNSVPDIAQGAYMYHSGNLYSVDGGDDPISGEVVDGINYIEATVVGTTLKCSFITDVSMYSYNQAYSGMYNGDSKLLNAVVFVIWADNKRGLRLTSGCVDSWTTADGSMFGAAITPAEMEIETLYVGDSLLPSESPVEDRFILTDSTFLYPPRGIYVFARSTDCILYQKDGASWRICMADAYGTFCGGTVFCDGTSIKAMAKSGLTYLFYLKY